MLKLSKSLLLFLCLVPFIADAAPRRGGRKQNMFYFQGMLGRSAMAEIDDIAEEAKDDQEPEAGTALAAALGYRWENFSLEVMFAHLGNPSMDVGEYYTEEHKTSFIGGGLHWTWAWFDLKLGWGTA